MAVQEEKVKRAAIMSQAQYPAGTVFQAVYTGGSGADLPPVNGSVGNGTALLTASGDKAIHAVLTFDLRLNPRYHQAFLTPVATNSVLYRVVIDGTNCNYTSDGSATATEIAVGIAAAINAAVPAVVTATAEDDDTVSIIADTAASFTMATTGTVGTFSTTSEDASTFTFGVWLGKGLTTAVKWYCVDGMESITKTQNSTIRIACSGFDYCLVQGLAADGGVYSGISPCGLE